MIETINFTWANKSYLIMFSDVDNSVLVYVDIVNALNVNVLVIQDILKDALILSFNRKQPSFGVGS